MSACFCKILQNEIIAWKPTQPLIIYHLLFFDLHSNFFCMYLIFLECFEYYINDKMIYSVNQLKDWPNFDELNEVTYWMYEVSISKNKLKFHQSKPS